MGAACVSAKTSYKANYNSPTKKNDTKGRSTPLTIDITPSPAKSNDQIEFTASKLPPFPLQSLTPPRYSIMSMEKSK